MQFLVMKTEYSDEKSAQSQDSGRTVLYPDLYALTNDEHWTKHWTMTPETQVCSSSRIICATENGDQLDICKLTTMPCVQRALFLNEVTDDFRNIKVEVPKRVDGRTRDIMDTCGRAAGTRANMRSCAQRKHQLKMYEDTVYHLVEQNTWSTDPGLTTMFLISST